MLILVKKFFIRNHGSTFIVLILTIAITMSLGASLLVVTMMNFKINKVNSEIKQSLYMSETGLNNAYVDAYDLVNNAIIDSVEKVDNYIKIYPSNITEAENVFINSYKLFVTGQIINKIYDNNNPYVQVIDVENLAFDIDKLPVCIQSKYYTDNNILKTTSVNLIIKVPDYNDVINNTIDISNLLKLENWVLSYE